MRSTVVDWPPLKAVWLHLQHRQSMRIANNGLVTEPNLTFAATEMKSQAYAPLWHDGPCLLKLQPARDFVASGSQVFFSGTQTANNVFN